MSTASPSTEAGINPGRVEFVRETTTADGDPYPAANPDFLPYSDTIREFSWTPGPGIEAQRGITQADPDRHEKLAEEHQLTVMYDLQRWFIDGTGDPLDAAYDGLARTASNKLANTHTVTQRNDEFDLAPQSTVNGTVAKDTRIYTVGIGGMIATVDITGDPGDAGAMVQAELGYEFIQARSYQIDQPDSSQEVTVVSSDAGDTTQTVTVEDEAGNSSALSLNGTTAVTSTGVSFADIDAIWITDGSGVPTDTAGDVTVTGATSGDALAVISGSNAYEDVEGDWGVPAIGTGSHSSAVGTAYEKFIGDTITDAGSALAFDINSFGVSVDNNIERTLREDSFGQRIHVGPRDTEITATVTGENETHDKIMRSLQNTTGDIVWTMTGGTLTFPQAVLTDPGDRAVEESQAVIQPDNSFSSEGVTIA